MSMSMIKKGVNYFLVIVDVNDPYELPIQVFDTLQECADWLQCPIKTVYNQKGYKNYTILIVEDVEDEV